MFDRYNLKVTVRTGKENNDLICDTWFVTIDHLIKFIDRFNDRLCLFTIIDTLYPERNVNAYEILNIWRSNNE